MRKIQSGEPVLPPESKVVQEDTFAAKVDKVVAALSVSIFPCDYSQIAIGQVLINVSGQQAPLPQCDHRS